jgi:hypothetical protein
MKDKQNICEAALLHPSYLGFIFYSGSKRYVGEEFVMPELPASIKKVGVFVDASPDYIIDKINEYKLDLVQLHGNESPSLCEALGHFVKVIKAFGINEEFDGSILVSSGKSVGELWFLASRTSNGGSDFLTADRLVGADGRGSIVRKSLCLSVARSICSRMVGLLLPDAELPFEGYGHVLLGGSGPVLCYRIASRHVRLILDVPLYCPAGRERAAFLWDGYADVLPIDLRAPFRRVLCAGAFEGAANGVRGRRVYGRGDRFLVGDAVGYHHPLTAVGLALGFEDALCLSHCQSVAEYRARRRPASRVAELLAVGLYEVLADSADEAVATRRAIYAMWRRRAAERTRTMGYLACRDTRVVPFAWAFSRTIGRALRGLGGAAWRSGQWGHAGRIAGALLGRLRWLIAGLLSSRVRGESRPAPLYRVERGSGVRAAPPLR